MALQLWELHGDGRTVTPGAVVRPEERLSWGRTAGIGMQHVVAMFGATFLVPVLTGVPAGHHHPVLGHRDPAVPGHHP